MDAQLSFAKDLLLEENSSSFSSVKAELSLDIEDFETISKNSLVANGDCIDYLNKIETDSVDLILTDPPYNLGNFMHQRNTNLVQMRENHFAYTGWDDLAYEDWLNHMNLFFKQSNRVLKKKGALIVFMSLIKIESIIALAQKHKFYYKTVGIWHKKNPMPRNMNLHFINSTESWIYFINEGTTGTFNNNGKVIHDFFESSLTPKVEKGFGGHPTQKPLNVLTKFVDILSNPNEVVLDPFMGSGSTGVAAEILDRKFIGIELEKKYYEIAKQRIVKKK